jgi:predicted ribosome quality control (RQC) complex YloA/Tae2 family protein
MVKNVKKPSGAMPGFVIYSEYKTILADGGDKLAERLKSK